MNLASLIELISQLVGGIHVINDASKWSVLSVQFNGREVPGTIQSVNVDPSQIEVTVAFAADGQANRTVVLRAVHYSPSKARVLVNGTVDDDAALIFSWRGNPVNMSRWGFDFKRVTLDGLDYRINTRFDP